MPLPRSRLCFALCLAVSPGCGDDIPSAGDLGGTGLPSGGGTAQTTGDGPGEADDAETGEPAPAFCEGMTEVLYDPLAGGLDAYPDDFYSVDADTPTGMRVDMRLGENVILSETAAGFDTVFTQASTLDGWGTTGSQVLRLSGAVDAATLPPALNAEPAPEDGLVLVDIDADPAVLVPFEVEVVAEDVGQPESTLVLSPLRPLAPMHRYAFALTQAVADTDGGCVAPSAATRELLTGEPGDPELSRIVPRIDDATEALRSLGVIDAVESLSVLVVFTTQHTVEDSAAVATAIGAAAPPTYTEVAPCQDTDPVGDYVICEASYDADDYTDESGVVSDEFVAQSSYTIPITVYLPSTGEAPFPTLIYGHGLGGTRDQAEALAEFAAPEGLAVVTLPAPSHGAHPDTTEFNDVLDFFGLSFDLADPLDALVLRDNFRQATFDKLQLLQMLLAGVDVDGDGTVDLDPASLHYLGVSLGGIMGPEFLAFAPDVRSGTLIVPGARVTSIVRAGEDFAGVIGIFAAMATNGEIARFFPVVQGVIDRGDGGVYAPFVARERLSGFDASTPQILVAMVIGDTTVPNVSNAFYTRALGVPHVGEVLYDVAAETVEALPVAENFQGVTAGMFQYDVVDIDGGPRTQPASHGNVARSLVSQTQILHFLRTWLEDGVAEIIDPYEALGIE
ncbi:MAG: hypothetical protein AAF721_11045 [Myxococcota bacterium]